MTVNTQTSRVAYAGNGTTTAFSVPFYFLAAADLVVIRTANTGAQTTLVLSTDYTVTGVGVPAGGTVTCTTAPALTDSLVIYRDPAATQLTDYQSNDPFPAETHERALDKLTMVTQRLRDLVTRSFRLSDGDTTTATTTLPSPQANNVIGWNSTATGLQNISAQTLATIVASGTTYADTFTGNGSQTSWTLTANPGALANLDVSIGGVTQLPGVDYLWSGGTTLTTTSAVPSATKMLVRYQVALPQGTTDSAASTFVASGTGAVTRVVRDKLRETVSVKDFGAVGDGLADDTAAIQAALVAATGKQLYFPTPSNFYLVSNELTVPTGTTIFGDGWGSKVKQTVADKNLFVAGKFSVIDGMHLIGKGSGATDFTKNSGVFADLVGNFTVQNCFIEQFEGSGVEARRCHDFKIINNFFFANVWSTYGAGVPGASTADVLLYSAQANSSRILISGNFCLSNNSQGIFADALGGNGDIIISNNICVTLDASTCTEAGAWTEFAMTTNASALQRRHGIMVSYSNQSQNGPRAVIHGNLCRNTGWTGIYKDGISQGPVLITANVCTNNGYGVSNALSGGIWIYADGNERVENNYISGFKNTDTTGSAGISIYATTAPTKRTVVANNTIRDSANCGVWIGTQAAMIDLIGNTLIDITRDGILWIPSAGVSGVGGHRIIGNRIARNSATVRPAIYLQPYASTLTIAVEGNDLIGSDNTTTSAVNCGIYFTGSVCRLAQIVGNRFDTFYYGYYNDSAWTGRDFDALLERNIVSNCNTGFILRANNNNVTVPLVDNRFINTTNRFGADGFFDCGKVVDKVGLRLYWESTAAPAAGSWAVGDRSVNTAPAVGSPKAWACTVAGTPGTWVSEGNL